MFQVIIYRILLVCIYVPTSLFFLPSSMNEISTILIVILVCVISINLLVKFLIGCAEYVGGEAMHDLDGVTI